jgi:prepilin-type N-terminal cleavage/methylation domain-containing protein
MIKEKNNKGFTLIELLVYIGIIGIALTVIMTLTVSIIEVKQKSDISRETQENARFMIQRMTNVFRWANSISSFGTNDITLDTSEGPVRFYLGGPSSDQLYIDRDGNTYELTTENVKVSQLIFTQLEPPNAPESVRIDLKVENRAPVDKGEYKGETNLITAVTLREK